MIWSEHMKEHLASRLVVEIWRYFPGKSVIFFLPGASQLFTLTPVTRDKITSSNFLITAVSVTSRVDWATRLATIARGDQTFKTDYGAGKEMLTLALTLIKPTRLFMYLLKYKMNPHLITTWKFIKKMWQVWEISYIVVCSIDHLSLMFKLEETVAQKQDLQYDFAAYFTYVLPGFIRLPIFVISFLSKYRMSKFCNLLVTPVKVIFSTHFTVRYK